jgi:hypothetical protein
MKGVVLVLAGRQAGCGFRILLQNMHDVVRKPERKRPLRTLRCRWADNIKIVRKDIGW